MPENNLPSTSSISPSLLEPYPQARPPARAPSLWLQGSSLNNTTNLPMPNIIQYQLDEMKPLIYEQQPDTSIQKLCLHYNHRRSPANPRLSLPLLY